MRRLVASAILSTILLASQNVAQQNATPETIPVIRGSVSQVVLDVIGRDKHEHLIRDLKPAEIEVYEDGVKQELLDFRLVTGAEVSVAEEAARSAAATSTQQAPLAPLLNSARELNLIALVVAPASDPSERVFAGQSAEKFLSYNLRPNTFVTVFSLGRPLRVVQGLTSDQALLKKAFDSVLNNAPSQLASDPQSSGLANLAAAPSPGALLPANAPSSGALSNATLGTAGLDSTSALLGLADASLSTAEGAALERGRQKEDQLDMANATGTRQFENLKDVIHTLGPLPGRKTVLLMADSLMRAPDFPEQLNKLVELSRAANITFYALDISGLGRRDWNQVAVSDLKAVAAISASQSDHQPVTKAKAMELDLSDYAVLSSNQRMPMQILAEGTGGFLIADTNDAAKPLRRIMEEVNTHYELTWKPKSTVYDGHFRKIEVKFMRKDVHAQYRTGYFALPSLDRKPLEAFELNALRVLDTKPLPHDFDFRVSAFKFVAHDDSWDEELTFEAPISGFTANPAMDASHLNLHVDFIGVIKDQTGQIVRLVSQDIPYQIPSSRLNEFRAGNFLVHQRVSLPPGHYVVESAVLDRQSAHSSTKRTSLVVGSVSSFSVSDIALVRKLNPAPAGADPDNPFRYSGSIVEPALGGIVPKGSDPMLYFVVYKDSADSPAGIVIRYLRDGKEVGRQTLDSQPTLARAIPVLASPKLEPGDYQAWVTALQGGAIARQSTSFTVQ